MFTYNGILVLESRHIQGEKVVWAKSGETLSIGTINDTPPKGANQMMVSPETKQELVNAWRHSSVPKGALLGGDE